MSHDNSPIDPGERCGKNIPTLSRQLGVSDSLIRRAISHDLIRVTYFGDRPIVPADEVERISREGLPNIPPGYKRRSPAPTAAKARKSTTSRPGKLKKAAGKAAPLRRSKRGEDHPPA